MKIFIFTENSENWIEEENNLLLHDIAVILDEKNRKLFLWIGPKSKKKKQELAFKSLSIMQKKYKDFELKILKEEIPPHINKRLKELLKKYGEPVEILFERTIYLKFYIIFGFIGNIISLVFFFNLLISLTWSQVNGNFQIGAQMYDLWILTSQILLITSLILFIANQILCFIKYNLRTIIITTNGVILSIGLLTYISQGIFLFLFQSGSTSTMYLISQNDLMIFLLINLIGIAFLVIPYIYNLYYLLKNSKLKAEK